MIKKNENNPMIKQKLGFVCAWGKDKKKTWSGTIYNLFYFLSDHFQIIECDTGIENKSIEAMIYKLIRKIKKQFHHFIPDMDLLRMAIMEKKASAQTRGGYPLLVFEECPKESAERAYIYLDCHAGYIKKLYREKPDIFNVSGFQQYEEKFIIRREKQQQDFLQHIAGIFTMGKWLQRELIENYNIPANKVFHVGGGCNLNICDIHNDLKIGNKFLFVGRDFERKGGYLVLEAFKKARRKRNDIELYIAGPKRLSIKKEAGVVFLGDLSSSELSYYFNLCDVFCMPSYFEAYGLVFIEALIYGLPCIARDAYEMPFFIQEGITGRLLKNDNVDDLANIMLEVLENKIMAKNVIDNQAYYINEYSWNTVSNRIAQVILCKGDE